MLEVGTNLAGLQRFKALVNEAAHFVHQDVLAARACLSLAVFLASVPTARVVADDLIGKLRNGLWIPVQILHRCWVFAERNQDLVTFLPFAVLDSLWSYPPALLVYPAILCKQLLPGLVRILWVGRRKARPPPRQRILEIAILSDLLEHTLLLSDIDELSLVVIPTC